MSFRKPGQDTQPSQAKTPQLKTFSFHLALYVHTYPCNIIYIHSFHLNTLTHTNSKSLPLSLQVHQKKGHRAPFSLTQAQPTKHFPVRFPCDSSDSASSCEKKFPPTPSAGRVDIASQGLYNVAAGHIVSPSPH